MSQPCTVTCMEQHTGEATRLACSRDEGGRLSWRFVSSVNQDWTRRQVAVVEAHQGGPGRCEVYALPSSRTDAVHVSAACDLDAVAVELVGHDIVVSGQGVELARVPTAVCPVDGAGCGERTAQRHATCLCLVCEARFGDGLLRAGLPDLLPAQLAAGRRAHALLDRDLRAAPRPGGGAYRWRRGAQRGGGPRGGSVCGLR